MLTPYLPYPLLSGGQIRSYNLLKNLAKKHEITLICLIKNDSEKQYTKNIAPFCHKVIVCRRPEKPWTVSNIWKTAVGKYPFLVVRNFSEAAHAAVITALKQETFDLIHAETFYVMPHLPKTHIPILLVEQTIEYQVYQHFVETMKVPLVRGLFSLDVAKIRYWEEFYWRQATRVVAMSEADREIMRQNLPNLEVSIVPNGVDTAFFIFKKKAVTKNPTILFVGNFKWLQNKEAVTILMRQIWPRIIREINNAHLRIVGRYPTPEILAYASENVAIVDTVDDIRQAYQTADVLLAPIYGPGGTRYKILEAMASGVPVVTTPQGIEGLGIFDSQEALIRTETESLAKATVELIKKPQLYQRLATAANEFVRHNYNWVKIAKSLDEVYEAVAHETH